MINIEELKDGQGVIKNALVTRIGGREFVRKSDQKESGQVRITLNTGGRLVAYKDQPAFDVLRQLREGDTISFTFAGIAAGGYLSGEQGVSPSGGVTEKEMVYTYDYIGVEIIDGALAKGGIVPDFLKDAKRELYELAPPRAQQTVLAPPPPGAPAAAAAGPAAPEEGQSGSQY